MYLQLLEIRSEVRGTKNKSTERKIKISISNQWLKLTADAFIYLFIYLLISFFNRPKTTPEITAPIAIKTKYKIGLLTKKTTKIPP